MKFAATLWPPARIIALRERLGSQTDAAEAAGVSQPTWSRWESGNRVPNRRSRMILERLEATTAPP